MCRREGCSRAAGIRAPRHRAERHETELGVGLNHGEARAGLDDVRVVQARRDHSGWELGEELDEIRASSRRLPCSESGDSARRRERARGRSRQIRSEARRTRRTPPRESRRGRRRPRAATARASRGIAFRLTPPSSSTRRKGTAESARSRMRPRALIGVCPPARDVLTRVAASRPGDAYLESVGPLRPQRRSTAVRRCGCSLRSRP